jgi:hypothetical protein
MIKQLILMFLASIVVSLILQAHQLGLLYTGQGSTFHVLGYLLVYALGIVAVSLLLAIIARFLYWACRVKQMPKLINMAWCLWVLIIMILAGNQLYTISTHKEPVNLSVEQTTID